MCVTIVTTRVISAHTIVTNINKSLYVTISTSPFLLQVQRLAYRPFGSPVKHITVGDYFIFFLPFCVPVCLFQDRLGYKGICV